MQIINDLRLIKHSFKAAIFSCYIANKSKLSIKQRKNIFIAGLLHDIGKVKLKKNILNKKEKLNGNEFEYIKQHVAFGVELLKKYKVPEEIYKIVEQHHERDDGTGYPKGLMESEISKEAKILRYADVYDALTSNRSYRKKYTKQKAIEIMIKEELI
jgi:putative nucleotidyltransferase with HDIG domain